MTDSASAEAAPDDLLGHPVARLRAERLASSRKPFAARGSRVERCPRCRVRLSYCLCDCRPRVEAHSAVCLLMHDQEPLKPSNTGWLIADVLADTSAYGWQRTSVDPRLLALLDDPQYQPYVVFPGEFVEPGRIQHQVEPQPGKRPLFILLDATWPEARKMFRKSPYLDRFPILSLLPEELSRYRLRRSKRDDHLCTAEVAALCLGLVGDERAARALDAYLDLFAERYLQSKNNWVIDPQSPTHQALRPFL